MTKKTYTIEDALTMYKETVSPPEFSLINILNQIPEKEKTEGSRQTIRSPYRWLVLTQIAALAVIVLAVFPTLQDQYMHRDDPFYATDQQVERFEAGINNDDYNDMLVNYNNLVSM
jgi:type VI protein secretion system component VasK